MQSIHRPVLLNEVVQSLSPRASAKKESPWYVDGTLGGCGHALAIAEAYKHKIKILGFDQDRTAINRAEEMLKGKAEEVVLINDNFRNLDQACSEHMIDGIEIMLLDLGLSSDELNESGKGFSFQKDEPLLMTLGDAAKFPFNAADIVNGWDEEDLANVIFGYGEERYARRIAKRITEYRAKKHIETSAELAEIVKGAYPRMWKKPKIHPATKTFQALRIAVNDELNTLRDTLQKGYRRLNTGGRMAVISFHSLEDRIVKEFFKKQEYDNGAVISKKPLRATADEILSNPRARSAKLRLITKSADSSS